jgi:acetylglutamate kinase
VDVAPLLQAIRQEVVPVISPLARDEHGQIYNINADIAASEVAMALGAGKAIYLSDVDGVMRDPKKPDSRIAMLPVDQIEALKKDGTISGGMIPKVDSAVKALRHGVKQIHFLDGRVPHALLLEIFTDAGIGTEIHS